MKLSELLRTTKSLGNDSTDPTVVIVTAQGGIPTPRMVEVNAASYGFDWTRGLFLLRPTEPIVVVRALKEPTREFAKRRLEELKTAHERLKFSYVPKAREEAWIEGFVNGIRAHVTSVNEEKDG
jgi:mRNA-degrading endonuclease toxin of MazEF toxin-antitoxin module